jgi:hypothetical protein
MPSDTPKDSNEREELLREKFADFNHIGDGRILATKEELQRFIESAERAAYNQALNDLRAEFDATLDKDGRLFIAGREVVTKAFKHSVAALRKQGGGE